MFMMVPLSGLTRWTPAGRDWLTAKMTPDELLDVFHRRIRLPDADTIPGWKVEHDGLVHRSYVEGPEGAGFVETPRGLGDDPDAVIDCPVGVLP